MFLIKKRSILFIVVTVLLLLTACGSSMKDGLLGNWRLDLNGETAYFEFTEETFISRYDQMVVDYIVTETGSDTMIVQIVDPMNQETQILFEGYFSDRNTIELLSDEIFPEGNQRLIRVDKIRE